MSVKSVAAQQAIQNQPLLRQTRAGAAKLWRPAHADHDDTERGRTWWITRLPLALLALLQRTVCVRKVGRLDRHAVLMHGRWTH
jgi:hypothetical protein